MSFLQVHVTRVITIDTSWRHEGQLTCQWGRLAQWAEAIVINRRGRSQSRGGRVIGGARASSVATTPVHPRKYATSAQVQSCRHRGSKQTQTLYLGGPWRWFCYDTHCEHRKFSLLFQGMGTATAFTWLSPWRSVEHGSHQRWGECLHFWRQDWFCLCEHPLQGQPHNTVLCTVTANKRITCSKENTW